MNFIFMNGFVFKFQSGEIGVSLLLFRTGLHGIMSSMVAV